jgi:BlaI family penicillinase repressor
MGRKRQDVTDAELAVLRVLWEQGPATIRELTEVLYPEGGTAHYATVQKLLERLEAKRCVKRQRRQPAHRYRAAIDLDALIGRRLEQMADKLCGGSMTPLLTHLLRSKRLSAQERRSLRQWLEELDDSNRTDRA